MSDIISIDKDKMRAIAASFDEESENVQRVIGSVNSQLGVLRNGGWVADAASRFYQQMDEDVVLAMNRLRSALTMAGSQTREITSLLDSAEDEACGCLPIE